MSGYVIDVSNPEERKETNKTVENLLEEYENLSNEIELYKGFLAGIIFLSIVAVICALSFNADFIIVLFVVLFFSFVFIKVDKTVRKKNNEFEETKINLLTSLKEEKIIIERNRNKMSYPRNIIIGRAKNNIPFFIGNERIDTVKLLLENPNIQEIVERKTFYEILKIHSKHQDVINKLCKEKERTKIIYKN